MGLFDGLLGGDTNSKFTPQEAYAGVLVSATFCDGHFADDEVRGLVTSLLRMKLYQRASEKQFDSMLDKLVGVAKRSGVPALMQKCIESIPNDLRDTAFANACNIVLADGVAEQAERDFINNLQTALKLDATVCHTIVQVMVLKNMG